MNLEKLNQAVEHIGAVSLREGSDRWAYHDDGTRRWYVVETRDLMKLASYLDRDMPDAYSHWCAATTSEEMPEGWDYEHERNAPFAVGDSVVGGTGEDADTGTIERIDGPDTALVAWDSGVRTAAAMSALRGAP